MRSTTAKLFMTSAAALALGLSAASAQDATVPAPEAAPAAEETMEATEPAIGTMEPAAETTEPATETTEPATDAMEPAADAAATDTAAVETEVIPLTDWSPDITRENAMSVEEILDFDVYGPTGEEIGDVENVLMGTEGEVLSVIAEVGGVWDIGDTHVNVPWNEIEVDAVAERVVLPVTEETVEDYTLFTDEVVTAADATAGIQEVEGDNPGLVETGPRIWQARELIDDYVRLRDGDAYVNYGYVDDIVIQDGQVSAVVVRPDVTWGARGLYAYPYYGYGYGWAPGLAYYDLPYARADVEGLEPFDEGIWDD